jgi:ELWxxDGT repeat protein
VSGDTLFFSANDGVNGYELWRSDGTAARTKRVKDRHGGAFASPLWLTDVGGRLFFDASNGAAALWRTDGTAAGTAKVRAFQGHLPYNLTNVAGALYFVVREGPGTSGFELWRSGGTAAKTKMVKQISAGDQSPYGPTGLTDYGGTLFFAASDGVHGAELWRSNGTEAGTRMVKDINPGSGSSFPSGFTESGGSLFFAADDGAHGEELWKARERRTHVR